jgi:glutaredoxin-like protein
MVYELDESKLKNIKKEFEKLREDVKLILFTGDKDSCINCKEIEEMIEQIAALSDKIKIAKGLTLKSEEAKKYKIDKHPAIVIEGSKGKIRYFGIPIAKEFMPFIYTLVDVSSGTPKLSPTTVKRISKVKTPVHLKVFTTPTCPYCPTMVRLTQKLAMINENIIADMIDALEFPELAQKYQVFSVPKIIINDKLNIDGVQPEPVIVDKIIESTHLIEY